MTFKKPEQIEESPKDLFKNLLNLFKISILEESLQASPRGQVQQRCVAQFYQPASRTT